MYSCNDRLVVYCKVDTVDSQGFGRGISIKDSPPKCHCMPKTRAWFREGRSGPGGTGHVPTTSFPT